MSRFSRILAAAYDGVALSHIQAVFIHRSAGVTSEKSDTDAFSQSVEFASQDVRIRLRLRDVRSAETFELGQEGLLRLELCSADGASTREVRLDPAVLIDSNLEYRQDGIGEASLEFLGRSSDGTTPLQTGDLS